ncbi:unnamed protein product [Rotaria sp. Silwood1]|nr:unnamed protein product [Rotaria sp. Silwood1]CAF3665126.1 unnamed protein product [Rotaria sp. Silwood1]CAF3667896.1 unnamed protein product [Rotaria sp. Silwood1]CAF4752553.1 unnamed protein product [Rotaria sp. Silwood1]
MTTKRKSTAGYYHVSVEEARREFGISLRELKTLMQRRGYEGIRELNETHGGLQGLGQKLKTNLIGSLSDDETDLAMRVAAFGRNEIPLELPKTFLRHIFDALKDRTIVIIIIFAIISLVLSFYHPTREIFEGEIKPKKARVEWIEGAAIIIAVLIVVLAIGLNNWTRERLLRCFQWYNKFHQKFNVVRGNTVRQIPINDIVVGDICKIKYGDLLPADGVIIRSNDLKFDESSLTGESGLSEKHVSRDPFLLSGQ